MANSSTSWQGRDAAPACVWVAARPDVWRDAIGHDTLDLSGAYRQIADTMLPVAVQVADPFQVVRLANQCVDDTRRRVQRDVPGHRGRRVDPLCRARKLLVMANSRLDDDARSHEQWLSHQMP